MAGQVDEAAVTATAVTVSRALHAIAINGSGLPPLKVDRLGGLV